MHAHSLDPWTHEHNFLGEQHDRNARRVWLVVGLTAAMMVVEIIGGMIAGSLALVADGWHMSTHAVALGISGVAYVFARRHADDPRFAFGTGKVGNLAAFTSAIILAMIAVAIAYESVERLVHPVDIAYAQAIPIAIVGLAINLVSAWLLRNDHGHGDSAHHGHHRDHRHDHDHGHAGVSTDLNLRAAFIHVIADAATSVLAIAGLSTAWALGWTFMDPIVGLVGVAVILSWAIGLASQAGGVLLDRVPDPQLLATLRARLEVDGDRLSDQHLWSVGPGHCAAVLTIVSENPQPPAIYKARLAGLTGLSHVTVEVEPCERGERLSR
jgi:cation diffusion facilitator family transporter